MTVLYISVRLTLCYFINFCRLIKLLTSSHPLISTHVFTLSTHFINVPALHTRQHKRSLPSCRAQALCANTPSQLTIMPFWFGDRLGVVSRTNRSLHSLLNSQLRDEVKNVRMVVVSPLWRGPGYNHGFILDGKSYRLG